MKKRVWISAVLLMLSIGLGSAARAGAEVASPAAEAAAAPAGGGLIEEKGLTLGSSSIVYPALREGSLAEPLRAEINDRILADGGIADYVTRMSQLISGGSLKVEWQGAVLGDVFSFAVSAEGAVETLRPAFVWTAGNIDLLDGHEILWEELFTDPEAAREAAEAYLEEQVAPEMSAHLLNSQLTPLPELFRITERGIILLYDEDRLSTLSDRAGDMLIPWQTVREQLDLREGGVAARMGIAAWLAPTEEATEEALADMAERVRAAAEDGAIPGIPVRLGDSVQALTEKWHLLTDPDVYTLGRFFSLEGAAFRGVFLMTDYLSEDWENSIVDGIRADTGSLYGLTVGVTAAETWRRMLGEPEHTITYDEEQAEAWRTVPGTTTSLAGTGFSFTRTGTGS